MSHDVHGEQDSPAARLITFFSPDRPVEGTVNILPAEPAPTDGVESPSRSGQN